MLHWRRCNIISKEVLINEEIRGREFRIIGEDGEQLGIMSREEALALADEKNLDLVNIAPKARPPVCKILDYGKYKYELKKREKEAKKKQKHNQVKEIRLDIQVKGKTAIKFLQDGDKVKVSLRFRGREMGYQAKGHEVMARFAEFCKEYSDVEKGAKFEGRSLTMILSPKTDRKK